MLELHRPQDSRKSSKRELTWSLPKEQPVGFLDAFAQSHRQVLVAAAADQAAVELVAAGTRSEAVANENTDFNTNFYYEKESP